MSCQPEPANKANSDIPQDKPLSEDNTSTGSTDISSNDSDTPVLSDPKDLNSQKVLENLQQQKNINNEQKTTQTQHDDQVNVAQFNGEVRPEKKRIPILDKKHIDNEGNETNEFEKLFVLDRNKYFFSLFLGGDHETGKAPNIDAEQERVRKLRENDNLQPWPYSQPSKSELSIFTPLYFTGFNTEIDDVVDFFAVGHLAVPMKTNTPLATTATLSPNPYIENIENDEIFAKYLTEPKQYIPVFVKTSKDENSLIKECHLHYASTKFVFPINEQKKCDVLLGGLSNANFEGSNTNDGFSRMIYKQSVTIWKPCPRKGYKCLGYVATNGPGYQPSTEFDHIHLLKEPTSLDNTQVKAAMFCVREDALAPGKLEKIYEGGTNYQLEVSRVIPQSTDGITNLNFFVAKNLGAQEKECLFQKNNEYYVLKKQRVEELTRN